MDVNVTARPLYLVFCLLAILGLPACSSNPSGYDTASPYQQTNDPLEGMNRAVFALNEGVDTVIGRPLAKTYKFVTPSPVRTGVRNALRNLRSPVNAANQLLQGDIDGAANDVGRALINSTIGLAGLIDVASHMGMEYEQEDFGQTLASWGVGHGPYLVLPIFGPSSVRDATGLAVDAYADPLRLYLFNTNQEEWHYLRLGMIYLSEREALLDALDDLRKNSFDYYAATRSIYYQRRESLIRDEDPDAYQTPEIPDYDDI